MIDILTNVRWYLNVVLICIYALITIISIFLYAFWQSVFFFASIKHKYFNMELETIKKTQSKIDNSISEIKGTLETVLPLLSRFSHVRLCETP